jgi:hypothetical protein
MPDYARVGAGQLAALMHRALERGDAAALAALRAALARRSATDQEACRREWIRQCPLRRHSGPVIHPPAKGAAALAGGQGQRG